MGIGYWNYRVAKEKDTLTGEENFTIHEVYYNDDGNPMLISNPESPYGESLEELVTCIYMMLKDAIRNGKEIYDVADFEEGGKFWENNAEMRKTIEKLEVPGKLEEMIETGELVDFDEVKESPTE